METLASNAWPDDLLLILILQEVIMYIEKVNMPKMTNRLQKRGIRNSSCG